QQMKEEGAVLAAAVTEEAVVAIRLAPRFGDDMLELPLQHLLEGLEPLGEHVVVHAVVAHAVGMERDAGKRAGECAARTPLHDRDLPAAGAALCGFLSAVIAPPVEFDTACRPARLRNLWRSRKCVPGCAASPRSAAVA